MIRQSLVSSGLPDLSATFLIVCRYPEGSGLPTTTSSAAVMIGKQSRREIPTSIASISSRSAGTNRQRAFSPEGTDKLFNAGKGAELLAVDQTHHRFALAVHQAKEELGSEFEIASFKDVTECAFVVEANELLIILFFVEFDFLGRENFAKCLEMQRLAIHEHAVEIKQHGGGPI